MPEPVAVFGFIAATLMAAFIHLVVGGDARRLALLLLAGWIAFGIGHLIGVVGRISLFNVGSLHLLPALVGEAFALILVALLTRRRFARRPSSL